MTEPGAVVVTWNSGRTVAACLASLPPEVPVVVVDNASSDDTVERALEARPAALILRGQTNLGFGAACNRGAALMPGRDVLLLNPDAALTPGCLVGLKLALAADDRVGVAGPMLQSPKGLLEYSWGAEPSLYAEWRRRKEHAITRRRAPGYAAVDWVTGGCCLIRREAWEAVGGFDEGYFLYFEDLDLCRRVRRAGFKVMFQPASVAIHERGESSRQIAPEVEHHYRRSQLRYYAAHQSWEQKLGLRAYLLAKFLIEGVRHPERRAQLASLGKLVLRGK